MSELPGVDRRQLLRLGALTAAAAAVAPLAGCSGNKEETPGQQAGPALLRVGAFDGTNTAGLDPRTASNGASLIVMRHVYDSLMLLTEEGYQLSLAESVEPNADATSWTIRIRDGVTFHDGRPVTSEDVIFSIRTLATPPSNRASVYKDVNAAGLKAVDKRTVEVPLKQPRGDFREAVLVVYSPILPNGTTDFSKGIGSGPYRMAGSDAQTVQLVATGTHWSGKTSVGELRVTRIADTAARLNAIKGGQIDYAVQISATGAKTEEAAKTVAVHRGGAANSNALSFAMNMQLKPFDDPRVRRAVRLAADRQALVDKALLGYGTVGADVVGKGLPGYAKAVADRRRDLDTAKRLFSEAGITALTMRAGEIVPGMMAAARLFAQQLAEAGVTLTIEEAPADTYYADLKKLSTYPFQTFWYANRPAALHYAAVTAPGASFNVIGTGPDYHKRLAQAQATVENSARASAFEALQMEMYESGGDLVWGYQEALDASQQKISGVARAASIPTFTRTSMG